jgi:hypothetical protein
LRERFSNGDTIEQDPRREDPVVYYVPAGDWARAIGIEIAPLYEEHRATTVTSRLSGAHEDRLSQLDDTALADFVARVAAVLSKWYPNWLSWSTEWPLPVAQRVGPHAVESAFERAGWHSSSPRVGGRWSWARRR